MTRVLVLEDNSRLGGLICEHLRGSGFVVDLATTILEFRELSARPIHSVYIVDLQLPDGNALGLIRKIRASPRPVPILIMSARGRVEDRILGLNAGADDYLSKPFHSDELLARVRALLRRPFPVEAARLTAGELELELESGEIYLKGRRLDMRPSERSLMALLIRRRGRLVTTELIEDLLYELEAPCSRNAVEKRISRVRQMLTPDAHVVLKTIRGNGYVLEETT